MSDKPVSLTVRDLDDHLRDLVKWKRSRNCEKTPQRKSQSKHFT